MDNCRTQPRSHDNSSFTRRELEYHSASRIIYTEPHEEYAMNMEIRYRYKWDQWDPANWVMSMDSAKREMNTPVVFPLLWPKGPSHLNFGLKLTFPCETSRTKNSRFHWKRRGMWSETHYGKTHRSPVPWCPNRYTWFWTEGTAFLRTGDGI